MNELDLMFEEYKQEVKKLNEEYQQKQQDLITKYFKNEL